MCEAEAELLAAAIRAIDARLEKTKMTEPEFVVAFDLIKQHLRDSRDSMDWLVKTTKWRFDTEKEALEDIGLLAPKGQMPDSGFYTPELTAAMKILAKLKGVPKC